MKNNNPMESKEPMNNDRPHELLSKWLKRKQDNKPSYSLRALARDLNLSSGFLSEVFNGKKSLGQKSESPLFKKLALTPSEIALYYKSEMTHQRQKIIKKQTLIHPLFSFIDKFAAINSKHKPLLSKWYNVALMELVNMEQRGQLEIDRLAKSLNLSPNKVAQSILKLQADRLIEKQLGRWTKGESFTRVAFNSSQSIIRNFHKQMIKKALIQLSTKIDQKSFDSRLITGITIAANPAQVTKAKKHLEEALHEVAEILSEGECREIYQINTQLFSLTT